MAQNRFMQRTIELAQKNIEEGGWPFSAVIEKDNEILSEGVNLVHSTFDPSSHGEIVAIRNATSTLQTPVLSGSNMYVVGLPCPMCLTCIILAKISKVFYAVDISNKDECLTTLPETDGLYNLVANGYGSNAIEYGHLSEFSSAGEELFKRWDAQR